MTLLLVIVLTGISLLLTVPALILLVEVSLALAYRSPGSLPEGRRLRLAVLMPAHDEAAGITPAITGILQQLSAVDRLLVVADNCSDETAALARAAGADVIERTDPQNRGKGFALDFGVRHLRHTPPDIVIIADADCEFAPGSIDRLARECERLRRPLQALYLMLSPEGAGPRTRIAQFAWIVKNQIRPTGLLVLEQPCQLMGTGMAFPWAAIASASLATGHIVEDLQLGLELARKGTPARFCPEAKVTSYFPQSDEGIRTQRTRWEHGHLGMIVSEAPRLLVTSLLRFDIAGIVLAIDLLVPPLTLFILLIVLNAIVDALFAAFSGSVAALIAAVAACMLTGIALLLSWIRYGRDVLPLATLAAAPAYVLRKVPIYIRFVLARQLSWVRSKRDP